MHNIVMLIKFIKQIANSFAKITNAWRLQGDSKPGQTSEAELFPRCHNWLERRTENLVKHLGWSFFKI